MATKAAGGEHTGLFLSPLGGGGGGGGGGVDGGSGRVGLAGVERHVGLGTLHQGKVVSISRCLSVSRIPPAPRSNPGAAAATWSSLQQNRPVTKSLPPPPAQSDFI